MGETWYTRWFNWRWRPVNIWGRYRLRHLPTMTPSHCSCEPKGQAFHDRGCEQFDGPGGEDG
jgi:hypothetical protein